MIFMKFLQIFFVDKNKNNKFEHQKDFNIVSGYIYDIKVYPKKFSWGGALYDSLIKGGSQAYFSPRKFSKLKIKFSRDGNDFKFDFWGDIMY